MGQGVQPPRIRSIETEDVLHILRMLHCTCVTAQSGAPALTPRQRCSVCTATPTRAVRSSEGSPPPSPTGRRRASCSSRAICAGRRALESMCSCTARRGESGAAWGGCAICHVATAGRVVAHACCVACAVEGGGFAGTTTAAAFSQGMSSGDVRMGSRGVAVRGRLEECRAAQREPGRGAGLQHKEWPVYASSSGPLLGWEMAAPWGGYAHAVGSGLPTRLTTERRRSA